MSTLDRLAGPGNVLAKEAPDVKEFDGLVRSGLARLKDAGKPENSLESRFDLAYGAAHALCLAALRHHGYRPSHRLADERAVPGRDHTSWVSGARGLQAVRAADHLPADIKVKLDDVLESLENRYPAKVKGLLPRIYAGSNMEAVSLRGLINLFSKDIFEADHGGEDLIGRVYEYFIGEFASSESKRGGEYFTPVSIVKTLVAMLEPEKGIVFDPCCGSGGMFVQSDLFTKHSHQLSFVGQESKDFTS